MADIVGLEALKHDHQDLNIDWVDSIDSTQSAVAPNSLLIAEQQTAGVGRRGNSWLTAKGNSICFSYQFQMKTETKMMSGYALIMALAIIQTMTEFEQHTSAQVKWPNDLFSAGKKFAGILINIKPNTSQQLDVTVGIGINWSLTSKQIQSIDQAVCNIPLTEKPSRGHFVSTLMTHIKQNNQIYIASGLDPFLTQWQAHDYLTNKSILIQQSNGTLEGDYCGIDEHGQLMASINGTIKHFSGGEVSVKPV